MAKKEQSQVPISEAPSIEQTRSDSFQSLAVEVPRAQKEERKLYWFGTLVMEAEFEWLELPMEGEFINLEDDDGDGQPKIHKKVRTTAAKLWFKHSPPIWAPRNRYFQQLDVTGLSFPAFTERFERAATNEYERYPVAWPGGIAKFTDSEVAQILESVRNHAIRPTGEPWGYERARIVNYTSGHMLSCPGGLNLTDTICPVCQKIEGELPATNRAGFRVGGVVPEHRMPGDLPMADYVYLLRIPKDPDYPRDRYHELVRSMEQFFQHQPPPLSKDLQKEAKAAPAA